MMVQIVTESLARYATVLQVDDGAEPWSVYDCFLPNPFRFVIDSSAYHLHYMVFDTESIIMYTTKNKFKCKPPLLDDIFTILPPRVAKFVLHSLSSVK